MKNILVFAALAFVAACNRPGSNVTQMRQQIDSLQKKLDNTYRPGLGEFMSGIQVHHAKLWYAGSNTNWKLAEFEINEIKEGLEDISKYNSDRPEVRSIGMIDIAIDSVSAAIKKQNQQSFIAGFQLLTSTCNNCHRATAHEFNVIKVPDTPPFTNQDFKPR
jgi:hypothetical protein